FALADQESRSRVAVISSPNASLNSCAPTVSVPTPAGRSPGCFSLGVDAAWLLISHSLPGAGKNRDTSVVEVEPAVARRPSDPGEESGVGAGYRSREAKALLQDIEGRPRVSSDRGGQNIISRSQ